MTQLHNKEKEQFIKLFKQEHIHDFDKKFDVLDVFLLKDGHITAEELQNALSENGYNYSLEFVTKTLDLMCRYGFAKRNIFDNATIRYEHRHIGQHHDHLICTKCKKIVEFHNEKLENLQSQIVSEYGFHMLQHKMEIYGICSDCLKARGKLLPLTMAKQGEKLIIRDFSGGSESRMRMLSMGLRPGDNLEIITNSGSGQVVVAVDMKRFVLGRGFAQKILVEPDISEK